MPKDLAVRNTIAVNGVVGSVKWAACALGLHRAHGVIIAVIAVSPMKDVVIIAVTVVAATMADADIIMDKATEVTASAIKVECLPGAHRARGVIIAVKAVADSAAVSSVECHLGVMLVECMAECPPGADLKSADSACPME